jgi:hypothetical protein
MVMSERKSLQAELRERIVTGLEEGLSVEQIQHQPRTQRLLDMLYPVDELIDRAHRDIIRGFIQQIVNEKGERLWVCVEQTRIPFDPEPAEADNLPARTVERAFFPAAEVADDAALKRAALLKLQGTMRGTIRRAGIYVDSDACAAILNALDEAFGRLLATL